ERRPLHLRDVRAQEGRVGLVPPPLDEAFPAAAGREAQGGGGKGKDRSAHDGYDAGRRTAAALSTRKRGPARSRRRLRPTYPCSPSTSSASTSRIAALRSA